MPIVMAPENVDLKITKILVDEKTKRHLENLGILVNAIITISSPAIRAQSKALPASSWASITGPKKLPASSA